jgi:hypothetical protein
MDLTGAKIVALRMTPLGKIQVRVKMKNGTYCNFTAEKDIESILPEKLKSLPFMPYDFHSVDSK